MARHRFEEDDWGADDASWDDDLDEGSDDDEDYTVPCPHCRRSIHEDAQRCPYCEKYISEEDTVTFGHRWWVIITAFVLLALMGWAAMRGAEP